MITALELIQSKPRVDGETPTIEDVAALMIEFAKMHCERQAILFQELAEANTSWGRERKELILNIYSLENIM